MKELVMLVYQPNAHKLKNITMNQRFAGLTLESAPWRAPNKKNIAGVNMRVQYG